MLLENIIKMEIAWILPLIVIFGFIFLKIILPGLGSSSGKKAGKKELLEPEPVDEPQVKEEDWYPLERLEMVPATIIFKARK